MKRTYIALTIASTLLCVSTFAGPVTTTMAPPPSSACGTGWYFGLQGGGNIHQDVSSRHVDVNGADVELSMDNNVGGYGGIKFGYVFGNADFRFALEEDWYYNGVDADAKVSVNGTELQNTNVNAVLNTAAFMTNLVLRYAPHGGCGLQPYIFGGIGGWWGETGGDVDVTVGSVTRSFGSADNGGFAFQLGAGLDYYFNPQWSIFTEYKFVDYTNAGGDWNDSNIGQHLIGGGFKVHF